MDVYAFQSVVLTYIAAHPGALFGLGITRNLSIFYWKYLLFSYLRTGVRICRF